MNQKPDTIDLLKFLRPDEFPQQELFNEAGRVRKKYVGNKVYFRGLIEFSNVCSKDCYYCGIRKSNKNIARYNLSDEEILVAAVYACEQRYASIVLQSGELMNKMFIKRIDNLLKKIHRKTNGTLHITLSLGEQSKKTYRQWFESGAHRYLLRIETANRKLYSQIHPTDALHDFKVRMRALESLRELGYQTGTGVMIGLPFQTYDDLANDLLFMKDFGIDMVGMGPYIEHNDTPMYKYRSLLWTEQERLFATLRMIALLRIFMPDINIAATTALQSLDKMGREKALMAGANVIMPNITPGKYRDNYRLYNTKPCTDERADDSTECLSARIRMTGNSIGYGEWGDSKYYTRRRIKKT
ncbi:MAG: [FeFe] hydrogenase H-cluster radical SAM maturase HydE [Bacteroidales bacterium]|nr:[FeFe] hydrogenase H-cluster radical SAM maturase HydE [Bacteroidales bacterium]